HDNTVMGVKVKDIITGETFDIKAKMVVNATGPWMENLFPFSAIKRKEGQSWAKAVNIIVKKSLFDGYAVGLEGSKEYMDKDAVLMKGKRLFFFVPWRGYTIIGTSYKEYKGKPDQLRIDKEDIEDIIEETNNIYPPAELVFDDVTFFHCGLVPMAISDKNISVDVQLDKHTIVIDHDKTENIKGLLTIKGVKYTTAPQIAKQVRNILKKKKIFLKLNQLDTKSTTARNNFISQVQYTPEKTINIENIDILKHLQANYGSYCKNLLNYIEKDKKLASLISYNPPLTVVEVLYSIREEMALKLADIVFRRTELGTAECPPKDVLIQIANIMADELGWDELRKTEEIREVLDYYFPIRLTKYL
ncbi:MAG: FAD-dependent oxidoreductase, partial [Bacteroidetes bacterium]|nr:FAD-dependent oxidoreductase [Bacteroidota bacterium]